MGFKTVVLKLYKPSKVKQEIIDEALCNYNEAIISMLNEAYSNLQQINNELNETRGKYRALALSKLVDSTMSRELNKYDVQPFKDSLKLEFGNIMANLLRNRSDKYGEVDTGLDPYVYESINNSCIMQYGTVLKNMNKIYPVYFCRYDTKRNYCLLYDREKDRFYAKIYLLNRSNARTVPGKNNNYKILEYIYKKLGVQERTGKKESFIITPLSFGKWQEKILKEAADEPERFKTARLFKKNKEYYLAITIEIGKKKIIKTDTFMGVSRGLQNKMNYTVVDSNGKRLDSGTIVDFNTSKSAKEVQLNEIHSTANTIRDIAANYKSQVVVLNFAEKDDRLIWNDMEGEQYFPQYSKSTYNCFSRLLEYKLDWICLPKPIKVSPVGIFFTCPNCGLNSKKNRFDKCLFICTSCGTTMDIDALGSLNLARKLITYNTSKIKIMVSRMENGVLFTNKKLGLNYFSHDKENHLECLKKEIEEIIKNVRDESKTLDIRANSTRMSLIKKMESSENFMDVLEFFY